MAGNEHNPEAVENICRSTVQVLRPGGGHGSGFLVREKLVATCWHVAEGFSRLTLRPDGRRHGHDIGATVIGHRRTADVALLWCEELPADASPLTVSTRNPLRGGRLYAVGTPKFDDLRNTVTDGTVSAIRHDKPVSRRLQLSAITYGGNSGGPLVDESGMVEGMLTAGRNDSDGKDMPGISLGVLGADITQAIESILEDSPSGEGAVVGNPPAAESSKLVCVNCGWATDSLAYCGNCGRDREGSFLALSDGRLLCGICKHRQTPESGYCLNCGKEFLESGD